MQPERRWIVSTLHDGGARSYEAPAMNRLTIFRTAFWAAALLALVLALLPQPPQLPGAPSDKIQHILAFLALGTLASFAYPDTGPVRMGVGLSLFGALIEVMQAIPALHRDSDPVDWLADSAAAAVILIILRWPRIRRDERVDEKG